MFFSIVHFTLVGILQTEKQEFHCTGKLYCTTVHMIINTLNLEYCDCIWCMWLQTKNKMKDLTLVVYLHKDPAMVGVITEALADAATSRVSSGL